MQSQDGPGESATVGGVWTLAGFLLDVQKLKKGRNQHAYICIHLLDTQLTPDHSCHPASVISTVLVYSIITDHSISVTSDVRVNQLTSLPVSVS